MYHRQLCRRLLKLGKRLQFVGEQGDGSHEDGRPVLGTGASSVYINAVYTNLKPELIQLVNQNKHRFSGYRIDALAKVAGYDIVRLPPYHFEELLDEAIALVTPENWARDCAHVVRLEEEAWEQDGAIESTLDNILITLGSDSSGCSDSSISFTLFLQGYASRRTYIVTQYPLIITVEDFWQLVYDSGSQTIVLLNDVDAKDENHRHSKLR
ncbi:hypothetical protein HPB52_015717 [Rhipicephalus sanguineus]|uniref:Tyrosine-protein phosphatase domain-containing protein n=1 Tax=Rhipicephalus sanguineus TaxID=34632 RepID=A0A9D4QDR2_RHISA|nr:hypothetical protein HPB52_015717 [Rhipicephalus sanguineus]